MRFVKYTFSLVIAFLTILFAALNSSPVKINYILGSFEKVPLSFALVITFILGALLTLFFTFLSILFLKTENYRLTQKFKLYEKEIANLRSIPLEDID